MAFFEIFPHLTQLSVAVLATWFYKEKNNKFVFYLMILLWVIVVVEGVGIYCKIVQKEAGLVYHIYSFFEYNLIALMYLSILKKKSSISIIKVMSLLFNLLYILTYVYIDYQIYVTPVGSFFVSVYCVLFLIELLLSDKILNYKKELPFWVTVGFLVFYLPSIPFFILLKSMQNRGLFFILSILVVFMNLLITYGLLCSKEEKQY